MNFKIVLSNILTSCTEKFGEAMDGANEWEVLVPQILSKGAKHKIMPIKITIPGTCWFLLLAFINEVGNRMLGFKTVVQNRQAGSSTPIS